MGISKRLELDGMTMVWCANYTEIG